MFSKFLASMVPAAVGAATLTLGVSAQLALAQTSPIGVEMLSQRHALTDNVSGQIVIGVDGRAQSTVEIDDFSMIATARITIQPGAMFPWHTHPGPVLVLLAQGELIYVYGDDCVERTYSAGSAFVDPGNAVHTAINRSTDEEVVVVATFLGATADGPLTIPVGSDEAASLNETCGTGGQ